MNFADSINQFNKNLTLQVSLPKGVEVMNPYEDKTTVELAENFTINIIPTITLESYCWELIPDD